MVKQGPGLRVSVDEAAGRVTVSFGGDVDLADAARVEEALQDAVAGSASAVSVDLTDVTFLGSTGVRLLLEAGRSAEARGTSLSIVVGGGPARRVIDLLGLRDVLGIVDPEEDAGSG